MYQNVPSHNAVLPAVPISVWKYDADGPINGGVAIVGGRVFLDTLAGTVAALNLRDGKRLWSRNFDNMVMSTPIVENGMVIVGTGRNGSSETTDSSFVYVYAVDPESQRGFWGRSEGDHIEALDAATGEVRWAYRTPGEDMPSPAFANRMLIFANGDGNAYGLDAASGDAKWRRQVEGIATMASATSADGLTFLSVCSNAQTRGWTMGVTAQGAVRWKIPFGNCDSSPTYGDGRVYVSGVDGNIAPFGFGGRTTVAAVDARTGRVLWQYTSNVVGPYSRIGSSERAIAGTYASGTYYQASPMSDEVLSFDARTGRVRWRFRTAAAVKMSPVVHNGSLFFGDISGIFYRLRAVDGVLQKTRIFDKPFSTSPPVIVGNAFICANGSSVYAFAF